MWLKTSRRSSYQINDLALQNFSGSVQVLAGTTGHLSHPPLSTPSTPHDRMRTDGVLQNHIWGDGRIWTLLVSTAWTGSSFICIKTESEGRSYQGAARDTEGLGCHIEV